MSKRYNPAWCSHMPLLTKVMTVSDGPVLELGMGPFSTPLLHWLCEDRDRELVSYDTTSAFFKENLAFQTELHQIKMLPSETREAWADIKDIESRHWGVVFIDQHPADSRAGTAGRAAHFADYVIIHDSDSKLSGHYHYEEIYPLFKYKYVYRKAKPHTTVLSNFKDLALIQ